MPELPFFRSILTAVVYILFIVLGTITILWLLQVVIKLMQSIGGLL